MPEEPCPIRIRDTAATAEDGEEEEEEEDKYDRFWSF